MQHLIIVPSLAAFVAGFIMHRIWRAHLPDAALIKLSRPDMLDKLLPYSMRGDKDRLMEAIGGFRGLLAIYRACGAIATLVSRHVQANPGQGNALAERTFVYALCGRVLTIPAMIECLVRRSLPVWPPILTVSLAQVYCDMACTLEAMEIHA